MPVIDRDAPGLSNESGVHPAQPRERQQPRSGVGCNAMLADTRTSTRWRKSPSRFEVDASAARKADEDGLDARRGGVTPQRAADAHEPAGDLRQRVLPSLITACFSLSVARPLLGAARRPVLILAGQLRRPPVPSVFRKSSTRCSSPNDSRQRLEEFGDSGHCLPPTIPRR